MGLHGDRRLRRYGRRGAPSCPQNWIGLSAAQALFFMALYYGHPRGGFPSNNWHFPTFYRDCRHRSCVYEWLCHHFLYLFTD